MQSILTTLELEVEVTYIYRPAEPEVRYYKNGDGYPGCPAEAEIFSVMLGKVDIKDKLTTDQLDALEELCCEFAEEPDDI